MASGAIEVHTRRAWRPVGSSPPPAVDEVDLFSFRGLRPGSEVRIGPEVCVADHTGGATIPLARSEHLRGHLGLVEVVVDDVVVGEVDVVPGKITEPAWRRLRSDLERIWAGLVLDPDGVSRLEASLPAPGELWARIEGPVHDILDVPREALVAGQEVRRWDRVRRAREMTPSVQRAGARGGAGLARVTMRSTDNPENRMVADTLRRLRSYAQRQDDDGELATRLGTLVRHDTLRPLGNRRAAHATTWGMRSDQRYRRVHAVQRLLLRPELEPTEGPGELRLGVRGMIRLYEYWVFLQVLLACTARYGAPLAPGFDVLAVTLRDGRRRLELDPGTTVSFPGSVHVAFEPSITARGDGWMGLEYVPHPDPARYQSKATPDVVVLREAPSPWVTVVDAKYVGRPWVDHAAAETHAKYARMRRDGVPVVRHVVVAHPHLGKDELWAGYGAVPMVPGAPVAHLPLPLPAETDEHAPEHVGEVLSARPTAIRQAMEELADSTKGRPRVAGSR